MTESECTCTELEQLTVCHDMRNEPHLVGCPRWGTRRNGIGPHRYLGIRWKPDGRTPHHRAVCMCGWVSTTADVGYGYAISHEADYDNHVRQLIEETTK